MNDSSPGPLAYLVGGVLFIAIIFGVIAGGAWLFSFKGTDSGQVCVVREGGPFDGRAIKEVRQPGSGAKPIGAFNHQDCLPITERDSNDVIPGDQLYPTEDSVQVIADGQALYSLTSDPAKIKKFYQGYGRRKWGGEDITSDAGFLNFQKQRIAPVLTDALREVIGQYTCDSLNNLCKYVQNPDAAVKGDVEAKDTTQNLSAASDSITKAIKAKLKAAFGDDYFENIRYQNLKIRFEPEVQAQITKAQSLRTQAANAKLDAQRKVAEAEGEANTKVAQAEGAKRAAIEQEKAYASNPTQRELDKLKAFCGDDGCDPQVIGGNAQQIITQLAGK
jgi:regulator of protease activity HflC (stomatin/prohibitin superfamily)